jgi:hypothetical protein
MIQKKFLASVSTVTTFVFLWRDRLGLLMPTDLTLESTQATDFQARARE